jgi:nodulation protein F
MDIGRRALGRWLWDAQAVSGTTPLKTRRLERAMDEVATKIVDILKKHMKEPRDDIGLGTALTDLKIESLDLAMIVFDIEDSFGIEIPYNANESGDAGDFKTVGSVVEKVRSLAAAKA